MNPNTGHLVADIEDVPLAERKEYKEIPSKWDSLGLQELARNALGGNRETVVDLTAKTGLAEWARKERQKIKEKAKAKRKQAKISRKKNRGANRGR